MEIIRNLTRRKLRNILTISGIVIGVLALVTMGAMAEKFNALLSGGATYFGSNVQVADSSGGAIGAFGGGLLTLDRVAALEKVDGVGAGFPDVQVTAKPARTSTSSRTKSTPRSPGSRQPSRACWSPASTRAVRSSPPSPPARR